MVFTPTYGALTQRVLEEGSRVPSRFGPTHEVLHPQLTFQAGDYFWRRRFSFELGAAEFLQMAAGTYDPDLIKLVAPNANHPLFTRAMAYGPRITAQMNGILAALDDDHLTRQAVLFIGTPTDGCTSSQPCTTTIQFLLRDERVHAVVSMRSLDLVRGLSYDVFLFGGMVLTVAQALGARPGTVTVTAGSAHLYEDTLALLPDTEYAPGTFELRHLPRRRGRPEWGPTQYWAATALTAIRQKRPARFILHGTLAGRAAAAPAAPATPEAVVERSSTVGS